MWHDRISHNWLSHYLTWISIFLTLLLYCCFAAFGFVCFNTHTATATAELTCAQLNLFIVSATFSSIQLAPFDLTLFIYSSFHCASVCVLCLSLSVPWRVTDWVTDLTGPVLSSSSRQNGARTQLHSLSAIYQSRICLIWTLFRLCPCTHRPIVSYLNYNPLIGLARAVVRWSGQSGPKWQYVPPACASLALRDPTRSTANKKRSVRGLKEKFRSRRSDQGRRKDRHIRTHTHTALRQNLLGKAKRAESRVGQKVLLGSMTIKVIANWFAYGQSIMAQIECTAMAEHKLARVLEHTDRRAECTLWLARLSHTVHICAQAGNTEDEHISIY